MAGRHIFAQSTTQKSGKPVADAKRCESLVLNWMAEEQNLVLGKDSRNVKPRLRERPQFRG